MKKLMMIVAMVGVIGMAGTAQAAPDLSAPGSFWVNLDDGGNNDAPDNGWYFNVGALAWWHDGDIVPANSDATEFKMTVTGLSGQYDVAVLALNNNNSIGPRAGLASGSLTQINDSNSTPTGPGASGYYQVQSDPGAIGTGTTVGGTLDIFFDRNPTADPVEGYIDGVVLTPQAAAIPEPAGLGLIGLALLAVRKKRN